MLRANPAAARVRKNAAGTALHAALYARHDDAVVLGVLRAAPDAAAVKDRRGALPVHAALEADASDAVVVALLEAHPEAAKVPCPYALDVPERRPSGVAKAGTIEDPSLLVAALVLRRSRHAAMRAVREDVAGLLEERSATAYLLRRHASLAARRTARPWLTPLHVAVAVGASPVVLNALVLAYPEACSTTDAHKCLPLHVALLRGCPASAVASLIAATPDPDPVLMKDLGSTTPPEARPLSTPEVRPLAVSSPEARPLVAPSRGHPRGTSPARLRGP